MNLGTEADLVTLVLGLGMTEQPLDQMDASQSI